MEKGQVNCTWLNVVQRNALWREFWSARGVGRVANIAVMSLKEWRAE
jgi:hypothetical protein